MEVAGWGKEDKIQHKRDSKSMPSAQGSHYNIGMLYEKGSLEKQK